MAKPAECFIVNAENLTDRLDVGFQNPNYFKALDLMQKLKSTGKLKLEKMGVILSSTEELPITGGATPLGATYIEEGIQFIRVQNIRRNELALNNIKYIPPFIHESMLKRSQLKSEDVLLTITGMTYGLSATIPNEFGEANMNQHSVRIRIDKEKILPKYLSYFLNSKFGRIQTDRYVTGSSRPALDYDAIAEIYILYPISISEQEKIVKDSDSLIDEAKRNKSEYEMQLKGLNEFVIKQVGIKISEREDSVFIVDINNERIDAKFNSPFLKELGDEIRSKPYKKLRSLLKISNSSEIPFSDSYKLIELEDIDADVGEVRRINTVLSLESNKIPLKKNQIVIAKLQPESGKIFLTNDDIDGCVGSSEFIPLELISDETTLQYLWCILRSPYVLKQWEYETTGSTRERIGETELYETLIPFPDKQKQQEMVKSVYEILEKVKEKREAYHENKHAAEKIFTKHLEGYLKL